MGKHHYFWFHVVSTAMLHLKGGEVMPEFMLFSSTWIPRLMLSHVGFSIGLPPIAGGVSWKIPIDDENRGTMTCRKAPSAISLLSCFTPAQLKGNHRIRLRKVKEKTSSLVDVGWLLFLQSDIWILWMNDKYVDKINHIKIYTSTDICICICVYKLIMRIHLLISTFIE